LLLNWHPPITHALIFRVKFQHRPNHGAHTAAVWKTQT